MHPPWEARLIPGAVIAVLGGGSVWTPYLLRRLAELPQAPKMQVRLFGPTAEHLEVTAGFARRLILDSPDIRVEMDLKAAVRGATIVLNQVRIGGWAARLSDELIPLKYGCVGDESIGLGGFRAAVRTRPFIASAGRIIARFAPNAWLLNLTNPSDLVCRLWRDSGCKRVISLCDYPQKTIRGLAEHAERPESENDFAFIGMTHLGWITPPSGVPLEMLWQRRSELEEWFRVWGALPTSWRMHLDNPTPLLRDLQAAPGRRARQLVALVNRLRHSIRIQDPEYYDTLLQQRLPGWYDGVVVPAVHALLEASSSRLIVGQPNEGRLPRLESEAQVEGWARMDCNGIAPESFPDNAACLADIERIGTSRQLAFAAVADPRPEALEDCIAADPFMNPIRSSISRKELASVLCKEV
jgi:6-phospho-beta-glucosidase